MAGSKGSEYYKIFLKQQILYLIIAFVSLSACQNTGSSRQKKIIIFHAGSLSVPFRELAAGYEKKNPGIKILLEPAGSLVCARKITELKKPCDIIASADYFVINELLIPDYAKWSIRFATNEMVLSYTDKSKRSDEINRENWYNIISSDEVIYSRADPNADPGGYRALFTLMLAEKYYNTAGLTRRLVEKDVNFIRPKEVDLIALLESNAVDYVFIYKSVARQHKLKYIELPAGINLSDPRYDSLYNTVSLEITGGTAEEKISVKGEYINYSLAVLDEAPEKDEAVRFVEFLLSPEGMEIFRSNGQDPIIPFSTEQPDLIPENLLKYLNFSVNQQIVK